MNKQTKIGLKRQKRKGKVKNKAIKEKQLKVALKRLTRY